MTVAWRPTDRLDESRREAPELSLRSYTIFHLWVQVTRRVGQNGSQYDGATHHAGHWRQFREGEPGE